MSLPLLAIGIGCKSGITAEAVVQLVRDGCAQVEGKPIALFTTDEKRSEPALGEAAVQLGLPLILLPDTALKAETNRTRTKSKRVLALFGVSSIAETAALAGGGPGSQLLLARIAANGVTCAIASARPADSKEVL